MSSDEIITLDKSRQSNKEWKPSPPQNYIGNKDALKSLKNIVNGIKNYKDFMGKDINIGDYVIYTQPKRNQKLFAVGVVEETENDYWPYSIVVKRLVDRKVGRYKQRFPVASCEVIKLTKEEIVLRILEEGTNFLKG